MRKNMGEDDDTLVHRKPGIALLRGGLTGR